LGSRSGPPLSGLLSMSRSGPPLSALLSMSRSGPLLGVGTSFGLSIRTSSLGAFSGSRSGPLSKLLLGISIGISRDFFPDLDQDLFRDLNRGLGQANRCFLFPQSFVIFSKKNWELFWNCIFPSVNWTNFC
jgi:hypothetical protein